MSLGDLLRATAARDPDAVAFVEGDRTVTYSEWNELSDRAATAFARIGLAPGEVVALMLPQSVAYPVAYLGAAKAGLVTTGINTRFREREIEHILDNSGAVVAVATDEFASLLGSVPRLLSPEDLLSAGIEPPAVHDEPDRAVAVVYTSGTTGLPKGATYAARNLEAIRRIDRSFDPKPHGRTLAAIPLPHMGFTARIAANIDKRACTVLVDRWTAREALEAIEREQLTQVGGIPTQLALMLMDPDFGRFDFSSLRSCAIGGGPASPELVRRIREGFGVPVTVRYSCTELGLGTCTRKGDADEVVAETVGRPLPEVELRIHESAPNGVGEIAARSPAMMAGYWREPKLTEEAVDPDGFFHTGDLGRLDPDGNLRLAGRTTEMYIRGGYNVYPVEVEAVLHEHPGVQLAAVIGVADEVFGERGIAFVVPAPSGLPPTPEELRVWVGQKIADYKIPDIVEIRSDLPMTPMYKVDKQALIEEAAKGAEAR